MPQPNVGSSPPLKSLNEDIEAVRTAVMKELDAGRNVMANAHSTSLFWTLMSGPKLTLPGWGGLPVCSALDGLRRAEREKEGKAAVTKLAFVAALW